MKARAFSTSAAAAIVSAAMLSVSSASLAEPTVELMHMWTSGSSAEALAKLADKFRENGGDWTDNAIAGHTASQYAALRARVMAGDAPTAVQLKGPNIHEWAEAIGLADLNPVADEGKWSEVMAPTLIDIMSYDGKFVAVPVNIHRVNWMYGSKKAMDAVGETELPKTWDEFNAIAEKMAEAGIVPVAHGGQDWQDITLFEAVAVGMGLDFYKMAFLDLDDATLRGPEMVATFDQLRKMVDWMDDGMPGRPWSEAAVMVAKGEAGFQFMGDWFQGNMTQLGYEHGVDFLCDTQPANDGKLAYTLNSDSFAFFEQDSQDRKDGQALFAELVMSPEVQIFFNQAKGSIPARLDLDLSEFPHCQQLSLEHLQQSIESGGLVPTLAHSMAQPQRIRSSVMEIVSNFMNTDMSSEEAANQVADAVQANM
ncbi:MAG: ABC transporter substrate-binding protein [Pseudomonadota bacterium]